MASTTGGVARLVARPGALGDGPPVNYRHAFHAGNFADVLKHAILCRVVEHLAKKDKPFVVIDTHAGTGRYDLASAEAGRSPEFEDGVARVLEAAGGTGQPPDPAGRTVSPPVLLEPWLAAVRAANPELAGARGLRFYPGSPLFALAGMRATDRLLASELHADDAVALAGCLASDPRAKAYGLDGWEALRSFLPPKERRGLIIVDPPYEDEGELDRLLGALDEGRRRFATGTYLLWFPIKTRGPVDGMYARLRRDGVPKVLAAELGVGRRPDSAKLSAAGLLIVNPPYTLEAELREALPWLERVMAVGPGSFARVERVTGD